MSEKFKALDYKLTPLLEGRSNYEIWSEKIMARLEAEEDLDNIKYRAYLNEKKDKVDDYNATYDKRIKWLIKNSLNVSFRLETKEISDCYDLWTTIKNKIHPASQLAISDIRENLFNIKMTGSVEDYIAAIRTQVEALKTLGKPMDVEEHFHYLRRGLPARFDNLRMAIRTSSMTPEQLADLIREEDLAQRARDPLPAAEANFTKKFKKKKRKFKNSNKNQQQKPSTLQCNNCPNMTNHKTENCRKYCKNCRNKSHWTKDCKKNEKQEANYSETSNEDNMMFTCNKSKNVAVEWTLDSGATNHIFNDSNVLHDLVEQQSSILVGNGDSLIGKARLPGTNIVLTGCLLAPKAVRNLISVHQLIKQGFSVKLTENGGSISGNGSNIPLIKQNRFFVLESKPLVCLASKHKLIHRRLGHLGEESSQ